MDGTTSADEVAEPNLEVIFDNESDKDCTMITIQGQDRSDLLMTITGALAACEVTVCSASITSDDGVVKDVFRVRTMDNRKVPEEQWETLKERIVALTSSSSRSGKPAIYGIVAAAEVSRLRPLTSASADEASKLELAAAEMAQAAAHLVDLEREIVGLSTTGADTSQLAVKEAERTEAAAGLERKMAAMEAVLAARRTVLAPPQPKSPAQELADQMNALMAPAPVSGGPAAGTGYEIVLQAFNWESHKRGWYKELTAKMQDFAKDGFTALWLPPPSDSVSPQGYLPRDLYDVNSQYGSEAELREMIKACQDQGMKAIADIVINHRCAHVQGSDGKWNKFGGRLAWDHTHIACNNAAYGGTGAHKTGDDYPAAPNIDHTQERVRNDLVEWMRYLRNSIGFDGWRFDFVRGYNGQYAKIYVDATVPTMAFGEYWDTCDYTDGVLNYNQDHHRQRTINWCDQTGGTCAAFDFTTKGVLQEALGRNELWRLVDAQGRPPGMIGMWPSRALTFVDNHDTGSTLNHWPFPSQHLQEGYAYIMLHPGTPTVFLDHYWQETGGLRKAIMDLLELRKTAGIHCRSKVLVRKAATDVYAATIDDKVAMKIGRGDWSPRSSGVEPKKDWKLACSGHNWAAWRCDQ